jgi:flagellar hook capping protein FlgD
MLRFHSRAALAGAASRVFFATLTAAAISLGGAGRSPAAPADTSGVAYALVTPPSAFDVGCQGPCECPITESPTYGSFVLVETGVDPLFTQYRVDRYIASFNNGPGAVAIVGSGQYRIGGELATMQQLTLDLEVWGQPVQHFDSGLVPVRTPFPQIDVACAVHGFACYDTILVVDAKPIQVTRVPEAGVSAGLRAAQPNPFASQTAVEFTLDRPVRADLTILDVEGRRVRTLVSGQLEGPGGRSVTWDGRRDDGRAAPAGLYWVVLRWDGGVDRTRIVKVN